MLFSQLSVLLVEDNPGDARLIREMLTDQSNGGDSYRLCHVLTLQVAIEKCSTENFDAALLDLNLPDSTGLETLKRFSQTCPRIPTIILTGLNDHSVSLLSMQYGALSYVMKNECTAPLLVRTIHFAIERKRVEEYLRHLATHDPLTGLPNRSLFYDRLTHAIHCTERSRMENYPKWRTAVMLIDLDDFKLINDSMGHAGGDAVLQLAAQRLQGCLRATDTIARLGGDEFSAIIEGIRDQEDCLEVGTKMLQSLDEPVLLASQLPSLAASIGISIYPDDAAEVELLVRCADQAMYTAKRRHGRICFYKDLLNT